MRQGFSLPLCRPVVPECDVGMERIPNSGQKAGQTRRADVRFGGARYVRIVSFSATD